MTQKHFKDIVHGYVHIDADDVTRIIDTGLFQRLKRVRHLTAATLFPSTNHTRFEHSLGTMHLANEIYARLEPSLIDNQIIEAADSERIRNTVKYAALLHDLGHTPFSHVLETFLQQSSASRQEYYVGELARIFNETPENAVERIEKFDHAFASAYLALQHYGNYLTDDRVDRDLFFRMITGALYEGESSRRNCLIGILNSDLDADRLDYLARDGFMTGTINVDIERIIECYEVTAECRLRVNKRALSIVSSFVHGREFLYLWVYNHRKTCYADRLLQLMVGCLFGSEDDLLNYLSIESIEEWLIDDHELECSLKCFFYSHYLKHNSDTCAKCSLARQYFERRQLSPAWKSFLDYHYRFDTESKIEERASRLRKVNDVCYRLARMNWFDEKYTESIAELLTFAGLDAEGIDAELLKANVMVATASFNPIPKEGASRTYLDTYTGTMKIENVLQESVYDVLTSRQRREASGLGAEKEEGYEHKSKIPYVYCSPSLLDLEVGTDLGTMLVDFVKGR